jgi:AraC-like DNA-binding protein
MQIPEYESYHENHAYFDRDFPYNTYLCSIPLDFPEVPVHWHDEVEFVYIKKGSGVISVDLNSRLIAAGDIAIILPGQLHSISQRDGASMEYENIIFHPCLLESSGADESYRNFLQPMLSLQSACPSVLNEDDDAYAAVKECLDKNDRICMHFPPGYALAIKGNLFSLFFALYEGYGNQAHTATREGHIEKLKSVIKYVELNYSSPMSISKMAELAGFSESHFMKYFKQTMGVSFTSYLNTYRLTMAARLLLQSDDTVLSIATEVGFDNLSYFNRVFKKQYHTTPSEFRKGKR